MTSSRIACIALVIAIGLLAIVGAGSQQNSPKQAEPSSRQSSEAKLKLSERIMLAKARGEGKVMIPATTSLYNEVPDASEFELLLSRYTIIIAEPIQTSSYIYRAESIRSWYKFKVIETLSAAAPVITHIERQAPAEFLPIGQDEFLLHREGGTVTVDGVQASQKELGVPAFAKSRRYLLVLSLNPHTGLAELPLGANSFLLLRSDNGLDGASEPNSLREVVQTYHGGSLEKLKNDLKARKP